MLVISALLNVSCHQDSWNNPHTDAKDANIFYSSFSESPKTLDPAKSYSLDENLFIAQIYEPPLQYHYLLRPFTLVPLAAQKMPVVRYWDKNKNPLPLNAPTEQVAFTTYDITIKPNIFYQHHPAFAKDVRGHYRYHTLDEQNLRHVSILNDLQYTDSRELIADDYVYEIKRLANPRVNSPILGVMSEYIVGLDDYAKQLAKIIQQSKEKPGDSNFLDLRNYPLSGAKVIDRYTYRITLKGVYSQFLYWLAMPFFAPVPWEADSFYSQPYMVQRNITLDWYPVGTGPYMLTENNPNKQMVLSRNPHFHGEFYPTTGEPSDQAAGYLHDAGKPLPFIDQFNFSLEKESIPRWNKFLQGYYDQSSISADNFDQTIYVDKNDQPHLTKAVADKGIYLQTSVELSSYYIGFNMLDPIVGGYDEKARKLRQAISIAINFESFISIFLNGRGIIAQGPIPPGVFGYLPGKQGMNSYVYDWVNGQAKRKSLLEAKRLLAEAGYPDGRNAKTGKTLILNYEAVVSSAPDDKAHFDWLRKQFARLGIELNVQGTQFNRFQEKLRTGNAQLFMFGWVADYPDPENFLFLLYGPNGKVKYGGENVVNYQDPEYDRLFKMMKNMPNNAQRENIINQMIQISRKDAPWVFGYFPKQFSLRQSWLYRSKPNAISTNVLKYQRLDYTLRAKLQHAWNSPILWPLMIIALFFVLIFIPVFISYFHKMRSPKQ